MLAVSPLRNGNIDRESHEMESLSFEGNDFPDFTDGNLLDSIDFDDLFDGDLLPDLEMDPEILAEFSAINASLESEMNGTSSGSTEKSEEEIISSRKLGECENGGAPLVSVSRPWSLIHGQEIMSKREERVAVNSSMKEADKGRKSSGRSKNLQGKKKIKVDWTPELHRRFVQAVEQLGVDKAVPSRILELMGIDCLTRHNIASHLQKYRSHRKHLLAREAEAANWNQKRQIHGGGGVKRDVSPAWISAPTTMGFPPVAPAPMPPHYNRPGPMHVWGHPSVDQHTWPKHLAPSPPHPWPPSYWHSHQNVPIPTPGTPCYPPHLQPMRFPPPPPVSAIPPPAMYKVAAVPLAGQKLPQTPGHLHPSKECVDAAVEDVLSKPWLPLPLGLKPPSMDSVMVELQTQGLSKIPTTCA